MPADIRYVQIRLSPEEKERLDAALEGTNYPSLQIFVQKLIEEGLRGLGLQTEHGLSLEHVTDSERQDLLDYLDLLRNPDPNRILDATVPCLVREAVRLRRKYPES